MRKLPVILVALSVFFLGSSATSFINHSPIRSHPSSSKRGLVSLDLATNFSSSLNAYLPIALKQSQGAPFSSAYLVNVPYFDSEVQFSETAIFWFGKVNTTENYAEVRLGYTSKELYIRLAAFDRRLWYKAKPTKDELTTWDAASVYLDTEADLEEAPGTNSYLFIGQLNWYEPRLDYQAAYRGNGSDWEETSIQFSTQTGYRGNAPNDDSQGDHGWTITYSIPFDSLGYAGPPASGTEWDLAVILHDRDDFAGTPIPDKSWPPAMSPNTSSSWGKLAFGLPSYAIPQVLPGGSSVTRHRLNGATVTDGMVGGGSICGSGLDWTTWGEANYAGAHQVNIQNQMDVADWPCFSKFYITFPLTSIPLDSTVISATLTLHQFGNAGGGEYGEPPVSLIQVFTIVEEWDENTLTWNNAPLAVENVSRVWVEPIDEFPGWPGVPRTWDVSRAVFEAHASGNPLKLVLYSADGPYHSGKYFVSSDTGDWNAAGRPTLKVDWGYP